VRHIEADSASDLILPGALWSATLAITNDRGQPTSDTLAITVVDDQGAIVADATAVSTRPWYGRHRVNVTGLVTPGAYTVRVAGTDDLVEFAVEVADQPAKVPDVDDVRAYLGESADQYDDAEIDGALAAERQRQRDACTIPARYTAALREALMRRVQRNLAMRLLPLALQSDNDGTAVRLGGDDPIVRSIEARYPKMVTG
jgi:hypothetical protein